MNTYLFRGNYVHKIKGTREAKVFPVRHDKPYAVLEVWDLALREAEIRRPKDCWLERITIMEVYPSEV